MRTARSRGREVAAVAVAVVALSASGGGSAQAATDDGLVSDRPDFVESSQVVGAGRFQVEGGFVSERRRGDGSRDRLRSTPLLLRYGVGDRWELRLETDGRSIEKSTDDASGVVGRARGFADVSLGAKWHVQDSDEAAGRPSLAWLGAAELATGSAAFRGHGVRPSLRFVAEWDLPFGLGLGAMPGVFVDRDDDGRRFVGSLLAVTLDKRWTDRFHTFVEIAGQRLASRAHGGSVVTFDFGGAWALSDSFQLDLAWARGLNRRSPDQWTAGFSARF